MISGNEQILIERDTFEQTHGGIYEGAHGGIYEGAHEVT